MQNEQETRTGEDRRRPTHCPVHQENSMKLDTNGAGLSGIKSSLGTLKWIAGAAVPIAMAIIGTFYSLTYDALKVISGDTKELKNMLTAGQIAAAAQASQFNQRLMTVEHDIEELEAMLGKKGKRR